MADQTLNERDSEDATDDGNSPEAGETRGAAEAAQADSLDDLRREKDVLQDRLLRTAADFENYRKRIDRERRDLSEFAAADVLSEMLPIIDNLERALNSPAAGEDDGLRKGVELIHRQMLDLLRKRGVKPISALGSDFDPNFHQAVIHEASADHREGEVIEELQRGYTLGDRLLRPAMVKVAKSA